MKIEDKSLKQEKIPRNRLLKEQRTKRSLWGKGGKISKDALLKNLRDKHDRY